MSKEKALETSDKSNEQIELQNKPKGHFIAYFDILGYENKVKQDNDLVLYRTIKCIIDISHDVIGKFEKNGTKIKFKTFSDNFLYCTEQEYSPLLHLVGILQTRLLNDLNVFIRGSLSHGNIIFDDNFVYGKGLIEAFKIEDEIAIFPRIVLDDSFIEAIAIEKEVDFNKVNTNIQEIFCIDSDNNKFVDYLKIHSMFVIEGHGIDSFKHVLNTHAKNISNNIAEAQKIKNRRIEQKYQWCKNYHNEFCRRHNYQEFIIE
jgi:hypothetical protein